MKAVLDTTPKQYLAHLRARFDRGFPLGRERYVGRTLGSLFSVRYHSGREFGRRNYPISNKAIGFVSRTEHGAAIRYCHFYGLTDPVSLALLFVCALLIFVVVGAPHPVLFALGWTAAVGALTGICTRVSATGQEGAARLDAFLRHNK